MLINIHYVVYIFIHMLHLCRMCRAATTTNRRIEGKRIVHHLFLINQWIFKQLTKPLVFYLRVN